MEHKYIGIIPYDENSDFEFAGRTEETWSLYDRIARNDYTVYYAATGEGKSSLIRAGLLPILRRRNYFPVYIVFEDKELGDIDSIGDVINIRIGIEEKKHNVSYEQSGWSKSFFTPKQSEELSNNLWWKLRNYCFKQEGREMKPLFIFDQFEEVFTKANYEWTNRFFSWLEEISMDYVPNSLRDKIRGEIPVQKDFKALFSFRTEYLGDLDYWCVQKHFIPSLQENRMCLKPLTSNGAREVISLNSALGKYTDQIIQGCAESGNNIGDENQPCVYALILSVVCQTLSEMSDEERDSFLENLNSNQDNTIDDILLRFYKKKLKDAGLDYVKDENIIADIEDALVDEKGKRSRRDTNEPSLLPLKEWIERLSDKKNGLIKEVGRKDINGETVKTVEFPHDRLCRAIDSSRKERQGKIAWKLKRQGEWMQFGIIVAVVGVIASLWNMSMPMIENVVKSFLSDSMSVVNQFLRNFLYANPSELKDYSLDEGFSSLCLMVLLVLFIPLITIFIVRKTKKWQIISSIISFIGTLLFGLLWFRNRNISFTSSLVPISAVVGFFVCAVCSTVSLFRLKYLFTKNVRIIQETSHSYWPLWGGYFLFACYLFYEFLYRTTFGINEPVDSSWALLALPMLYILWAMEFFCMKIYDEKKKKNLWVYFVSIFVILFLLFIISFIPYYNTFRKTYGFFLYVALIVLFIAFSIGILHITKSNSKYYIFSTVKKVFAVILGGAVILITFFLNLGYNPFVVVPHSVCYVSSWRTIVVQNKDSLLGVIYPVNGDTIIPCCISPETYVITNKGPKRVDILLSTGNYPFTDGLALIEKSSANSVSLELSENSNKDSSLLWNSSSKKVIAKIPVVPTLEEYLYDKINKGHTNTNNIREAINYYAAKLFIEMRQANVKFVLYNEKYDSNTLKSLSVLDSLQDIALDGELKELSTKDMFINNGKTIYRDRMSILEDKHLVDFHCELSRSYLLCLIKDRANHLDMPAMFTLTKMYLLVYFTKVPCMNIEWKSNVTETLNSGQINKQTKEIINEQIEGYGNSNKQAIYSEDILNRKLFAWYNVFNSLCLMDIGWNSKSFVDNSMSYMKDFENQVLDMLKISKEIGGELSDIQWKLDSVSKILNGAIPLNNKEVSFALLVDILKNYHNTSNSCSKQYEIILELLDKMSFTCNLMSTMETDESFNQLKNKVVDSLLLVKMKEYKNGIYNNEFENICKNFILVSMLRMYDVDIDLKNYLEYTEKKDSFFKMVEKINSGFNKQRKLTAEIKGKVNENKKKLMELLRSSKHKE